MCRCRGPILGFLLIAAVPSIAQAQAVGPEFQVNSFTFGPQVRPAVASDASGNFVVVWTSQFGQDGSFDGVFGQRYAGAVTVDIDIRPGTFPNRINPTSTGLIPVAILTIPTFDATTVDPLSVEFGPNAAIEAHGRGHIEDLDADGDKDLLLHFKVQATGILCGSSSVALTGQTDGGQGIQGSDSIVTVGCN